MTISIKHDDIDAKILWSLDQSWTNEVKWYQGRVEVTPSEATETNKYRVGEIKQVGLPTLAHGVFYLLS